jgi:hypothetical protein
LEAGASWHHEHDKLGQVLSGKKYWSDSTSVPGMQFDYLFDDIGNCYATAAGENQSGTGLRPASYGAYPLTQYTRRTVPGGFDVLGAANAMNASPKWTICTLPVLQRKKLTTDWDQSMCPALRLAMSVCDPPRCQQHS